MKLVAKTLYGLEKVLAGELTDLGAVDVTPVNRAVVFHGNKSLLYKSNYCARTALSILMPIAEFRINSKDDLYNRGLKIEWEKYLDPDDSFSVIPVVNSPHFNHTGYSGLLLKDSIADYFRKKTGRRPSVTCDPRILINLHISNDLVTISIDSSGDPLFKRGYRKEHSVAPLNEVLAAGILLLSGWDGSSTLTDPMCGSGTIPIEAALIACNIPPGRYRTSFGFQRWKDYDDTLFNKIKEDCNNLIKAPSFSILGSDISSFAVQQSIANVDNAGLDDYITITEGDFKDQVSIDNEGLVFLNPPYGERLQPEGTDKLYSMIGTTLKHNFSGTNAWLITSNRESLKNVGLKPKTKYTLFNGALECVLLKYEMYKGSKKKSIN